MPKEYVYGESLAVEVREGDEVQTPVVEVGWHRDGLVQVASKIRECELFFDSERPDAPIPCQYGFYTTLDRRGINDLIRHLRKARDQAFGRDE